MKKVMKDVRQVSFVVKDLEATLKYYEEVFGIQEWQRFEIGDHNLEQLPHFTRGKQIPFAFKGAKAYIGRLEFEFMQPISGDSIYMEFLKEHGPGFHHVFAEVDNFDEAVEELKKEYPVMLEAITPMGFKVYYFDSFKELGYAIEIGMKQK